MCCEVFIEEENETRIRGPASCLVISTTLNKRTVRVWDCRWESGYLHILPEMEESASISHRDGSYYNCNTPNNTTFLQSCTPVPNRNQTLLTQPSTNLGNTVISTTKAAPTLKDGTLKSTPILNTTVNPIPTASKNQSRTTFGIHRSSPIKPSSHSSITPIQLANYSSVATMPDKPGNRSTVLPTTHRNPTFLTPTPEGTKGTKAGNSLSSTKESLKTLGNTLMGKVNLSDCTSISIQKLLVNIEDIVRPSLRNILNTTTEGNASLYLEVLELHVVVTSDFKKTIRVPDSSGNGGQSQGSVSLSPGSIDSKHGRLGMLTIVFKFQALCKSTKGLKLDRSKSNRPSSVQSPIVSVLAMTTEGDIHMLQDNATIMFRTMNANPSPIPSSVKCVFLNRTSRSSNPFWSSTGMTFVADQKDNYTTCLTDHLTSFAVLINYQKESVQLSKAEELALDLITKIGCSFAFICLVACILTFACVRNLSAVRYRIHLNLCVALAAAQLIFVAGIEATNIKGVCKAVAIILHYFFIASFAWMCVEAIHLFTKIVSVFNMQAIRMRHYFALGWGIPAVIVIISVSVDYDKYSTSKLCWLSLEGDFIWAFISPVIIIVSVNAAVLIAVIVVRVSLKGNPLKPTENKKFAGALKTVIVLFPLLGLCWVFGLMGVVTQSRPFLYAFVVLSSLQGVFILVFQCIGNTEVRGSLKAVKNRYSMESSIRNEQKSRTRESRLNGSKKTKTNPESRSLLTKVSIPDNNSKQIQEAATKV